MNPAQPLPAAIAAITPSQTIGPFPHEAWQWAVRASAPTVAPALWIEGRLLDGQGSPINDGWVEAWMPDVSAAVSAWPGWCRLHTDEAGGFSLALAARPPAGEPAAYLTVFARGLLLHQCTAVFLADAPGLDQAPLLAQVPAARRASLLAQAQAPGRYRWDIRLQGPADAETVFFDYR